MNITIDIILALVGSGAGSSLLTEAVSFFNKKLTGTPFQGTGALILSAAVAFLMGAVQVYMTGLPKPQSIADIISITGAIWAASQVFFHLILKRVDPIHVTPETNTEPLF